MNRLSLQTNNSPRDSGCLFLIDARTVIRDRHPGRIGVACIRKVLLVTAAYWLSTRLAISGHPSTDPLTIDSSAILLQIAVKSCRTLKIRCPSALDDNATALLAADGQRKQKDTKSLPQRCGFHHTPPNSFSRDCILTQSGSFEPRIFVTTPARSEAVQTDEPAAPPYDEPLRHTGPACPSPSSRQPPSFRE